MTSIIPSIQCGASYFPSILREEPSLKKIKQSALVDRLFQFRIQISSAFFYSIGGLSERYVRDSSYPKDQAFIRKVTGWLHKLPKSETGFQLLKFIESNSTDSIIIAKGGKTCVFQQDNTFMILIKEDDPTPTIIQRPTGEMERLQETEADFFGFAHECVHIRHMIQGVFLQNLREEYKDLYFPNAEEMLTILGYANYRTERLKDPISENAIRQDFLAPKRVSHIELPSRPAYFGLDGTIAHLIENNDLGSKNHLKMAIEGACTRQMSRKGNHVKVIELLIKHKCCSTDDLIENSIEYLLYDAGGPAKLKMSLLKRFGNNLFHNALESEWLTVRLCKKWARLTLEAEGVQGVRNLLHAKNSQGQTVLQVIEKLDAEGDRLISFLKKLEKECRYKHPSPERLFSIVSTFYDRLQGLTLA